MTGVWRAVWRLVSSAGRFRCRACGRPLRRLEVTDLPPEAARTYRLAGTLGGFLATGYVCDACPTPGGWVLID